MSLLFGGVLAWPLCAQEPIRGPMLGWVWDSQKESIRGILGIAGSSVLGKGLDVGDAVKFAAISGNQEYALILLGESRTPMFVDLRDAIPFAATLDGAAAGGTRVILSPRGNSAAVWYEDAKKMTVIGGLRSSPAVMRDIDFTNEGTPAAMAISDDGIYLLASYPDAPDAPALLMVDGDGNRFKLPKDVAVRAVAFRDGLSDAILAGDDGVFVATGLPAGPTFQQVSDSVSVTSVAASDGAKVLLVDGNAQTVVELNVDSGESRTAQCPCSPSGLVRMTNSVIFRLNEVSSGPLWLLEIQDSGLRTVFVPPDPSEPTED